LICWILCFLNRGAAKYARSCQSHQSLWSFDALIVHGLIIYAQNHLAHPDSKVRAEAYRWFQAALEVTSKLGAEACGGHIGAMSAADYADLKGALLSEIV
jgi:hypothetical protein